MAAGRAGPLPGRAVRRNLQRMEQEVRRRGALVNVLHYPRIIEDGEGRQWAFRVMGGSKSTSPPKWGIAYVSEEGRTGYRSTPDRPDLDAYSDADLAALVNPSNGEIS